MRWSIGIGRLWGTPIRLHGSLVIVLVLLVAAFSQGADTVASVLMPLLLTLGLIVSVLLHELGHALCARRFGVETSEILLMPIGGVAILRHPPKHAMDELWIALAGPVASLVVAGCAWLLSELLPWSGLAHLAVINLALGLFNLFPAFPLDGGRVLRAALSLRLGVVDATRWAARLGRFLALGVLALAFVRSDVLLAVGGLFVLFSATAEARATLVRELLDSSLARDVMSPSKHVFGATASEAEVEAVLREHGASEDFPVAFGDRVIGVVARADLETSLKDGPGFLGLHTVLERGVVTIQPDATLRRVLEVMGQERTRVAVVADRESVCGTLRLERLAGLLKSIKA